MEWMIAHPYLTFFIIIILILSIKDIIRYLTGYKSIEVDEEGIIKIEMKSNK